MGSDRIIACLGYSVLAFILWVAWQSSAVLLACIKGGMLLSVVLGFGASLMTAYYTPGALVQPKPSDWQRRSAFKGYAYWLLSCISLCLLSYYFFDLLERQTQINPRLYAVQRGVIVGLFRKQSLSLGFLPWCLYVFLGLGLAYSTQILNNKPLLTVFCLSSFNAGKTKAILNSLLSIPLDLVKIGWIVVSASFMALWMAEWIAAVLHMESFFLRPLRLVFMGGLIVFVLRKPMIQWVLWMEKSKASLGTALAIYAGLFLSFLLWLHGTADYFSPHSEINLPVHAAKSILAGFLSPDALETHFALLIIGWWCLWLPWMVSLAARAALGSSMLGAVLKLGIVPFCLFVGGLPSLTQAQMDRCYLVLHQPWIEGLTCLALCAWLWSIWGGMRTVSDFNQGAMKTLRSGSQRHLSRWITVIFAWLPCYLLGHFILGWKLTQFMLSAAACVMLALALVFNRAWLSSLMPSGVLRKYTPQARPLPPV